MCLVSPYASSQSSYPLHCPVLSLPFPLPTYTQTFLKKNNDLIIGVMQKQAEAAQGRDGGAVDKKLLQTCAEMIKELNDNLTQVCMVSLFSSVASSSSLILLNYECRWALIPLQVYDIYSEFTPVKEDN